MTTNKVNISICHMSASTGVDPNDIKNISKRYKLYDSNYIRLKDWLWPFGGASYREKWVLKDINLEIKSSTPHFVIVTIICGVLPFTVLSVQTI